MSQELSFDTRDEYNRKTIAEKIVTLLESPISISPIVIDGGWGTGKTEFSKKLATLINNKNDTHSVIYIDAFAEDHGSDSNLLIVLYVQIMPDDLVMQLHRF
ncbi:hypothetical protein APT20_23565 [Escherichia coli]|nr:hypothetical protein APT20_23565 [Escherichia coli]